MTTETVRLLAGKAQTMFLGICILLGLPILSLSILLRFLQVQRRSSKVDEATSHLWILYNRMRILFQTQGRRLYPHICLVLHLAARHHTNTWKSHLIMGLRLP